MRISDWSSDVCSSDLQGRRSSAGRLRVPPGRLRGLERRIGYGRQDLSRRRVPRLSAVSGQTVPCLLRQGVQRRCDRCLEQAEAAFAGVGNTGSHRIRGQARLVGSEKLVAGKPETGVSVGTQGTRGRGKGLDTGTQPTKEKQ